MGLEFDKTVYITIVKVPTDQWSFVNTRNHKSWMKCISLKEHYLGIMIRKGCGNKSH